MNVVDFFYNDVLYLIFSVICYCQNLTGISVYLVVVGGIHTISVHLPLGEIINKNMA